MREFLVTYGKYTHVTPKNPRVAEEADYSRLLVVFNFQYTDMLTNAIEINWKSIP